MAHLVIELIDSVERELKRAAIDVGGGTSPEALAAQLLEASLAERRKLCEKFERARKVVDRRLNQEKA